MSKSIIAVNPTDKSWTHNSYVLDFGAYGDTRLLAYANCLQDALDECIDWIVDNAPGLLCDDQVKEAYDEAIAEGKTEDEAYEISIQDMTTGGNCGNHIASWEWALVVENPTQKQLVALSKRM